MTGEFITLRAGDGHDFSGYLARPDGAARGAVVVVQEIFGVNHHIRSVCDRYAAAGWTALAPALFDRVERGVELAYDQPGVDRGRAIMGQVSMDAALADIGAALEHLGAPGDAAVVGFCWGGTLAWLAAARLPVRAAVGYYGGQIAKHVQLTPRAPVLLHFGEKDTAIPLSVSEEVRAARPEVMVHLYPAGHGFSCDERASYDADSARRAWTRTQGLLEAAF